MSTIFLGILLGGSIILSVFSYCKYRKTGKRRFADIGILINLLLFTPLMTMVKNCIVVYESDFFSLPQKRQAVICFFCVAVYALCCTVILLLVIHKDSKPDKIKPTDELLYPILLVISNVYLFSIASWLIICKKDWSYWLLQHSPFSLERISFFELGDPVLYRLFVSFFEPWLICFEGFAVFVITLVSAALFIGGLILNIVLDYVYEFARIPSSIRYRKQIPIYCALAIGASLLFRPIPSIICSFYFLKGFHWFYESVDLKALYRRNQRGIISVLDGREEKQIKDKAKRATNVKLPPYETLLVPFYPCFFRAYLILVIIRVGVFLVSGL